MGKKFLLSLAAAVFFASDCGADEWKNALPMSRITENAAQYHRKVVSTEGKISSKVKTKMFRGKKYTIFKMRDAGGRARMLVYMKGFHRELKKGDRVRIKGRFYEKRKYLFFRLKNVIKGRKIEALGSGTGD